MIEAAAIDELPVNPPAHAPQKAAPVPDGHRSPPWRNHNYDPNLWASGGTAILGLRPEVEEPFGSSHGTLCRPTCRMDWPVPIPQQDHVPARQDISAGLGGLPMRLMLRVVGQHCEPLDDVTVTVWHPGPSGTYVSSDPNGPHQPAFLGRRPTDRRGIVVFDSCFPGPPRGSPTVVHVQILRHNTLWLTSQFVFDDAMSADVYAWHGDYPWPVGVPSSRGTLAWHSHDVGPEALLHAVQMADGSLLAHQTVVLRDSLQSPLCAMSPVISLAPLYLKAE